MRTLAARAATTIAACALGVFALAAQAGPQMYEPMAESVRAALHAAITDRPPPIIARNDNDYLAWRAEMSLRLTRWLPTEQDRLDLLDTVHYEATRAGLDPQLILGLIQVESAFRKYAVSSAGARGYMQIMPFWVGVIGSPGDNLFHMRTNLRYGCIILRHYLDIEKGNLFRALGRYNGSLGKATYPDKVRTAWEGNWKAVAARTQAARVAATP
jgi:soluble lytic murein transglycosylase-like protein